MAIATAIGALVLLGASSLVDSGRKGNEFMQTEAKGRKELDSLRKAIRDLIGPSSVGRVRNVTLSDNNTAMGLSYVCDHVAGVPVWGARTHLAGLLLPSTLVMSLSDAALSTPVAANADDLAFLEAEVHPEYQAGWMEMYWPITLTIPMSGPKSALLRSVINPSGEIHSTCMVTDTLVPNDVTHPAFRVTTVGSSIRVQMNLHPGGDTDRIHSVDFYVTPRN